MTHAPPTTMSRPPGVLVADDDTAVLHLIGSALAQDGFAVWLAAHGRAALDVYRQHREHIDVALLDVCMPELDGPQTMRALRELAPRIRCCFMTGYFGSSSREELVGLGADAVLLKPFRMAEVTAIVRSAADQARAALSA